MRKVACNVSCITEAFSLFRNFYVTGDRHEPALKLFQRSSSVLNNASRPQSLASKRLF